jgi:hypothetical protein
MIDYAEVARKAAHRIAGTCDSLDGVLENMGHDGADNLMEFCKEFDRLVFCCTSCDWWHEQSQNADREGNWICRECAAEK